MFQQVYGIFLVPLERICKERNTIALAFWVTSSEDGISVNLYKSDRDAGNFCF